MIHFVIDIGSNSCRLMKAEVNNNIITPIYKKLITTRMGQGVNDTHLLTASAIKATSDAVYELFRTAKEDEPSSPISCFATSAARDAKNRELLINEIFLKTGLRVDVISGECEANISYAGTVGMNNGGMIDIGGGSTEIAFGSNGILNFSRSFDIGAVRAKDMFLCDYPRITSYTCELLSKTPVFNSNYYICGGTATTIAAMMQKLAVYEPALINGYIITKSALCSLLHDIKDCSLDELRKINGLQPQRADVIRQGMAILIGVMESLSLDEVIVSDRDNLEGYLMKLK